MNSTNFKKYMSYVKEKKKPQLAVSLKKKGVASNERYISLVQRQ